MCSSSAVLDSARQTLTAVIQKEIAQLSTTFKPKFAADKNGPTEITATVKVTKVEISPTEAVMAIRLLCDPQKSKAIDGLSTVGFLPDYAKASLDIETKCTYPASAPKDVARSSRFSGVIGVEDMLWDVNAPGQIDLNVYTWETSVPPTPACGNYGVKEAAAVANEIEEAIGKALAERMPQVLYDWFQGGNIPYTSVAMIKDYLYIGGYWSVTRENLEKLGITANVNASGKKERAPVSNMKLAYLPVEWGSGLSGAELDKKMRGYFKPTGEWIEEQRKANGGKGKILVNCAEGAVRSATLIAAYLLRFDPAKPTLEQILTDMTNARPIRINPGFMQQLKEYEAEIIKERAGGKKT